MYKLRSSVDLLGNRKIECAYVGFLGPGPGPGSKCRAESEYSAVIYCIRFEVGEASIGDQGLALLGSDYSDVVRLDIDMPTLSGIEPLERSSQPRRSGGLVVDSANRVKLLLRDDGAPRATLEIARMKSNSVMDFGRASGPPYNLPAGAPVPPPTLPGRSNGVGGLPIKVGDQLIGGVSVSGAPTGDQDAVCANAGLAKAAEKLR